MPNVDCIFCTRTESLNVVGNRLHRVSSLKWGSKHRDSRGQTYRLMENQPPIAKVLAAGSLAGCSSMIVCHPLDVLRVRMQTDSRVGLTVRIVLSDLLRHEGPSGLYRGFWPPFFAQGLYKATIFCTNFLVGQYIFTGVKTPANTFASGFIAGSVNSFVVAPIELLRTRLILTSTATSSPFHCRRVHQSRSMSSCLREILAEPRGIRGLWRGLLLTIVRDGPGVGLYLLAFEESKSRLACMAETIRSEDAEVPPSLSATQRIAAAACAGIAFWMWALPVDGVKTLFEIKKSNVGTHLVDSKFASNSTRAILASLFDGPRGMLGGALQLLRSWPVALGRGLPSAVITLTTYDTFLEILCLENKM